MGRVSQEQIARAKRVDILDYLLRNEPDNLRRAGNAYYLKDHDSLEVSNGLWNWHSRGVGGRNVIDYLIKVRGYDFVDAVKHIISDDGVYAEQQNKGSAPLTKGGASALPTEERRKVFKLPPQNRDNERVIAYLNKRGIDMSLIQKCIDNGSLYESAGWHNCVFVGRDDTGAARFASIRGTAGDYKCDVSGSDKRFGFAIPQNYNSGNSVAVFESPIDALSHQSLYPKFDGWRLSLGGTSLCALQGFLERHNGIKYCVIATDNDKAGNIAAKKISEIEGIAVCRILPPAGKDWNDALQIAKGKSTQKPSVIDRLAEAKETAALYNERHSAYQTRNASERG